MSFQIPEGFRRIGMAPNPFLERVGPLFANYSDDDFVMGFHVEAHHCNPGGTCHGGMMSTLADMLLILGSNAHAKLNRYLTTVNLSLDFLAPSPAGAWLEGRVQVLRVTKSLIFSQGTMTVDGKPVLRASGILKPVGEADPQRFAAARTRE